MNNIIWKDIVKIKNEYFQEEFNVEFENKKLNDIEFANNEKDILKQLENVDDEPLYDCSNFFDLVAKKYNVDVDDIQTYLFDNIDLPDEVCKKFDIAWLGGYINGINI